MRRIKRLVLFSVLLLILLFSGSIFYCISVPGSLTLFAGDEYSYRFLKPFIFSLDSDNYDVVKINNTTPNKGINSLSEGYSLKTQKEGVANLSMKVFGLIPLRTIHLEVVPSKSIIACGGTVGIKLKLNGILVIGVSDVKSLEQKSFYPAKEAGIRQGDFLVEVNGVKLTGIEDLVNQIDKANGAPMTVKYRRDNKINVCKLKPVLSQDDRRYHVGLWVRDSTAGIGTLTFIDAQTKAFGALGHGITDIDTGTIMDVNFGELLESHILDVKKGKKGVPGELKGVFIEDKNITGVINKNNIYGIYGYINEEAMKSIPHKKYQIANKNAVKTGAATILANIDQRNVAEYSIEIEKVSRHKMYGVKGMIIKVTDPRLINVTGGIVQGMSGCPIIQNGKFIGAVTHVLVNDPTRGYGIFIEYMLNNIEKPESMKQAG